MRLILQNKQGSQEESALQKFKKTSNISRGLLQKNSTYLHYNDNNSFTQDTHTYIQSPQTNIESHIAASQSDTIFLSTGRDPTIMQSQLENETHTQSYINMQPLYSFSHNRDISQTTHNTLTHNYNTLQTENISYADNSSTHFQDYGNSGTHTVTSQNWYVGGSTGGSTAHSHQRNLTQKNQIFGNYRRA